MDILLSSFFFHNFHLVLVDVKQDSAGAQKNFSVIYESVLPIDYGKCVGKIMHNTKQIPLKILTHILRIFYKFNF